MFEGWKLQKLNTKNGTEMHVNLKVYLYEMKNRVINYQVISLMNNIMN